MRKLFAIVVLSAAIIPAGALADIDNANQCKARGDGAHIVLPLVDTGEADRGSGCINAGGTQVIYVGGELDADQHGGGMCGAVVVLDDEVTPDGDPNFNPADCQ
jgi:hypothetical protein